MEGATLLGVILLRDDANGKLEEEEETIPLFPLPAAQLVALASAAALAISSSKCIDDSEKKIKGIIRKK